MDDNRFAIVDRPTDPGTADYPPFARVLQGVRDFGALWAPRSDGYDPEGDISELMDPDFTLPPYVLAALIERHLPIPGMSDRFPNEQLAYWRDVSRNLGADFLTDLRRLLAPAGGEPIPASRPPKPDRTLSIAMVFESRITDFVYEGGGSELDLISMLGGEFVPGINPDEARDRYAVDFIDKAVFPDGSFALFVPDHVVLLTGWAYFTADRGLGDPDPSAPRTLANLTVTL